ncbi:hypothetical protein VP01_2718g1 [Puccinia sorghi]|uniref:Uncharacterized protein n=1 Tax=Puccinia sorghi TaxID=27349 RepID=A0A0L6V3G7_9BASI|nr:hypothetical protein VP01_2718g1 [Puccinia sorghi]
MQHIYEDNTQGYGSHQKGAGNAELDRLQEKHQAFLALKINYRSFTGMLNYLACCTCPNLASAVSILSCFNQKPGINHWKEVVHCTQNFALCLQPKADSLIDRINFYTDATWAEDQETRISQSRSLAFWKPCPIIALSDEQEVKWLGFLIEELWRRKLGLTLFHIDKMGFLDKLKNFVFNSKTKPLETKAKSLQEKVKNEEINQHLFLQ